MRQKLEMLAAAVLLILAIFWAWGCATLPVREPYTVIITVVDQATRTPIQGATVSCNGRVQISSAEGRVVFPDIYDDMLKLYTMKTGYWPAGTQFHRETNMELRVRLEKK